MEDKSNILGILYFIIARKVKRQLNEKKKKMCVVYGEGAMTDWMWQKWFAEFHAGNFLLDDVTWSSRPGGVDTDLV